MSSGWIDISECTEGYWLFRSCEENDKSCAVLVDCFGVVFEAGRKCSYDLDQYSGKALKLADINNNGKVLVEKKGESTDWSGEAGFWSSLGEDKNG